MKHLYAANYTPVGYSGGVARLKTHLNFFSPQALELFFNQILEGISL